ncbi:MAG TPA: hypothetical protein VFE65_06390, partial [Pseudonocardia sp.]|nr:hypothetical protein [Pseudonocardia sp.]
MSVTGFLRQVMIGRHDCRVLIEVPDLGVEGWRRLCGDPGLSWRRIPASRRPGTSTGGPAVPRRRRARASMEPRPKPDAPVPAVVEAVGSASGTPALAKRRVASRALVAVRAAGLHGDVLGAADAEPASEPAVTSEVWSASGGVLVFGPADRDEVARRFAVAASAWELDTARMRAPEVPDSSVWRRRAWIDVLAGLCLLPLLLMAVATVGPWLGQRTWALWLAASIVCVAVPLLAVQALSPRWPLLTTVRVRVLGLAAVLVLLVVVARAAVSVPIPPSMVLVGAALLVAVLSPVALRLLPHRAPGLLGLTLVPIALAAVSAPIGDMLNGVYLGRLGLRATDVAQTFAQRWWSGAYFGIVALAGLAVAATAWGVLYQLDAMGRRKAVPPASVLTVLGAVYLAALLALASGAAWKQAAVGSDGLPGRWGGITPVWVCWSAADPGRIPFAGVEP